MTLPFAARYFSSRSAITFPLAAAFVTVRAPDTYSFWASIMMSALSDVDAVLAGMPSRSRKEEGAILKSEFVACLD